MPQENFSSLPFSANKTVSWVHIGDTHLTRPGEQNEIDLGKIVDEINAVYAGKGIDFVFVPGDIADDGSTAAYETFRKHLDRLKVPWFGIVGDHDVHEERFDNFKQYVAEELYSSFNVGPYTFIRMNAFSAPRPDSFVVDDEQLAWLQTKLQHCSDHDKKAVIFLHCYPSDLKAGGKELTELLHRYPVLIVDMGHTHYNEVSNDGVLLYSATRSTGQIEEGPVGYSVVTLDANCLSWHFVPLGSPSLVNITQPVDERLYTKRSECSVAPETVLTRVKVWSEFPVAKVYAQLEEEFAGLDSQDGIVWEGSIDASLLGEGERDLQVVAKLTSGAEIRDSIRVLLGPRAERTFGDVDQDNAIGEWKERGLLGTQLGPNKNGKKW